MTMNSTAVIVGASVAGVRTAQSLRSEGADGQIVLIGAEPELPYDKPPLSKQFLAGYGARRLTLLSERDEALGVELRLGVPAQRLEVAGRDVVLADGRRVRYDHVVIATGFRCPASPVANRLGPACAPHPRRQPRPGRERLGQSSSSGAVSSAPRWLPRPALGAAVTVVDPLPRRSAQAARTEIGELMGQVHPRHGVGTRFGFGVQAVTGEAGSRW